VVMKNVFAIGAERDGTARHAQCAISILAATLALEHRAGILCSSSFDEKH